MDLAIVDFSNLSEEEIRKRLFPDKNVLGDFHEAERKAAGIIEDVLNHGDEALLKYTRIYDSVDLKRENIEVSSSEIERFSSGFDETFIEALKVSIKRVGEFHRQDIPSDWFFKDEYGNRLGQRYLPIEKVGIYVPGGKALYPSSVVMTAVPAMVAGVSRLILSSPPSSYREPSEICLAAKLVGGIDRFYRVGGVQIIAAMAFGTETVEKVDKIVGPGNIYVAAAKKLLYGVVDIDMIAGPSEVVVVWDGSSNVQFAAADVLAQAEHDEDARAICIVFNMGHAEKLKRAINELFSRIERKDVTEKSLARNGRIFVVRNRAAAVALINEIAPEHLEIMTENAEEYLDEIRNAGAVFIGDYSPVAIGDYIAGPSHVLPTGGTARFFSPLSVRSFFKSSSIIEITPRGCEELGQFASIIAEKEKLNAHRDSIKIRRSD